MKVIVFVKATPNSEKGVMPTEQLLREMGEYNQQLVNAGIMLDGQGLHPSAKGKRVKFVNGKSSEIGRASCRERV